MESDTVELTERTRKWFPLAWRKQELSAENTPAPWDWPALRSLSGSHGLRGTRPPQFTSPLPHALSTSCSMAGTDIFVTSSTTPLADSIWPGDMSIRHR